MTVVLSAMGTRMDCDGCDAHVASPSLSIAELRHANGYVIRDGRDYCPACRGRSPDPSARPPHGDGPAAA
jgi:hypothetical protein